MGGRLVSSIQNLLAELKRLFPNELPRVTPKTPFDPLRVNRDIGKQEVIRAIESYILTIRRPPDVRQ